ncbi:MAG: AAA family ATPase [Caldilineaceae bacterium]|nr:AAA family ATPase [Caldilineaceae bacterium]HRJ41702.1 AAA family ATPase [Caldilineaceae bacterium]
MAVAPLSADTVQDALKRWHDPDPDSPLASLRLIRDMARPGHTPHALVNQLLLNLLNQMEKLQPDYALVLKLRFLDALEVYRVANRLNVGEATVYRRQKEAIAHLTELVAAEEAEAQAAHLAQMAARMEASSYEQLFGADEHLARLQELLAQDAPPWLILLTGLGGMGKTALADALLRRMIQSDSVPEIAWTTARQQQFQLDGTLVPVTNAALTPAALLENLALQLLDGPLPSPFSQERVTQLLHSHLQKHPHLIVVDNLETVQDVMVLLPVLRQMANPSKFLLTSRQSIPSAAYLYHYPLPPLPWTDALALVRFEAASRNLPLLLNAREAELYPIFEAVGGNPLALRLVVGQTHHHPLHTVLEKLAGAQGASVEALFGYIYRRAWELLDDDAQQLFLSLPLLPESGADLSFLAIISGLAPAPLNDALETLLRLNLLDHRSHSLRQSFYTIHGLTRTFLLEQVVRWQV